MKDSANNRPASSAQRARIIGGGFAIGLVALIALGGLFLVKSTDAPAPSLTKEDSLDQEERVDRRDAGVAYRVWKQRDPTKVAPPPRPIAQRGVVVDSTGTRWVVMRPDIIEEPALREDAGDGEAASDASDWADPVNQRVLGRKSWIAEVSEAENEAIEAVLDAPNPTRYPIDLGVRQWSVELAAEVVEGCFGETAPSGRFALNYALVADGTRATFEDVHLTHIYNLEAPGYTDCVVETLTQRSFRSSEDGRMTVSRPFFFDGTQAPK